MNEIKFLLNEADIEGGMFFLFVLILAFVVIVKNLDFIAGKFGIVTKKQLHEQEQENAIHNLEDHMDSHEAESDQKMDKIFENINQINQRLDCLSKQVERMQEKSDAVQAARIRDRVSQAYSVFKSRGGITPIEKEATLGLIAEYRKYYSTNTFVNDVIEPFIQTCKVLDEKDE